MGKKLCTKEGPAVFRMNAETFLTGGRACKDSGAPGTRDAHAPKAAAHSGPFRVFFLGKFRLFHAVFTSQSPKGDVPPFPGEKRNEIVGKIVMFLERKGGLPAPH